MHLITFSPLFSDLTIKASVDQGDATYQQRVAAISGDFATLRVPVAEKSAEPGSYEDLSTDDVDLRLCVFDGITADETETLRFHVFPGGISIVQFEFSLPPTLTAKAIEAYAQTHTRDAVGAARGQFESFITELRLALPADWLEPPASEAGESGGAMTWIARTLVLDPEELADHEELIRNWLLNTAQPEHATALLNRTIDYSMTWLNYVVATGDPSRLALLCSAMRIAQYFYSRQNTINDRARHTLARAYTLKDIRESQSLLAGARSDIQLLRIQYDTLRSLLNRSKRRIVDQIMKVWDYEQLVGNGNRMVEASTSRIQEIAAQRAERSSFVTDLILTVITFLAVIDVSLMLSQYSREVMSRPVLEYRDSDLSWILSAVAAIDTDKMLVGGMLGVLTLLLLYAYWKLRK